MKNRTSSAVSSGGALGNGVPGSGRRVAASFLLRFWAEPRETSGARPRLGSYISRLGSDEEHYFGDLRSLVTWLQAALQRELGEAAGPELGGGGSFRAEAERVVPAPAARDGTDDPRAPHDARCTRRGFIPRGI